MPRRRREPPLYHISAAVLRTHESKRVEGGVIASLSIPWGFSKGDDDLGGYHLVWPRDLVGDRRRLPGRRARTSTSRRVLRYLQVTQEPDGHWPQNMWLDGTPYWQRHPDGRNGPSDSAGGSGRARGRARRQRAGRAAGRWCGGGRVSRAQRSGEPAGSLGGGPGLLAVHPAAEIAALLVAADWPTRPANTVAATYLRETADAWNASIERWLYVTGTDWRSSTASTATTCASRRPIGPTPRRRVTASCRSRTGRRISRPGRAALMVSLDALALVRFGLRAPDDPRIVDTVKVIDATLKVETPHGPAWHRYQGDGYGEHADGEPFDGTGSRPRLAAADRRARPLRARRRTRATSPSSWRRRSRHSPARAGCCPSRSGTAPTFPSGSCSSGVPPARRMPLVWAHAEYLKLCRSLRDGEVFDRPPQTVQRYLGKQLTTSRRVIWRFNNKIRDDAGGQNAPRRNRWPRPSVHWSVDGWRTVHDSPTRDTTLGVHVVDLPTMRLRPGDRVDLTFYWPGGGPMGRGPILWSASNDGTSQAPRHAANSARASTGRSSVSRQKPACRIGNLGPPQAGQGGQIASATRTALTQCSRESRWCTATYQ